MASRNPILEALAREGKTGNPILDEMNARQRTRDSITGADQQRGITSRLGSPAAAPQGTFIETIENPNAFRPTVERYQGERARIAGEGAITQRQAPDATIMNALRGAGITTVESWKQASSGLRAQFEDAFGAAIDGWVERNMPNAPGLSLEEQRRVYGQTNAMRDYEQSQRAIEDATPQFDNWWADAAYGGLSSLLQTAPGMAAGVVLSPGVGLAILGGQVEGQSYAKYRQRGADPALALAGAVGEGATEILTEKIPMGWLADKFGTTGFKKFLGEYLAREMPTEQVATFVQDAIDTAIANPDKSWDDFWAERSDAAGKTAVATLMQSGAYAGLNQAINKFARDDIADAQRRADPYINRADAFDPNRSTKVDAPLTPEDRASPLSATLQEGKNALADAMAEAGAAAPRPERPAPRRAVPTVADTFSRMVQITLGSESRNRDYDDKGNVLTSSAGAKGRMQVLDGTNTDPGFGVRPAKDNSLAERARVGRDYLAAMLKRYGGDPAKMWAAYNWGPGNLDNAIEQYGDDWLANAPSETRSYVMKNLTALGEAGFNTTTGDIATIAAPEQAELDTESPLDFAARILGADWMNDAPAPAAPETPAPPATTPQPQETEAPDALAQALGTAPIATETAPEIRGEAVDNEWSRFAPESGTLNIPRGEMPQIKAEHRGAFANFLKGRGINSEEVTVPAARLRPTQAEYSEGRVASAAERGGGDRAILISSDGYIVDGHHQWMAARDKGEDVRAIQIDAPIAEVLAAGHDFPSSTVEDGAAAAPAPRRRQSRADDLNADLLTFLAANGGIQDTEGHSLRRYRNLQRPIAGLGSLIRKDGMTLDYARERLEEVGWLPEGSTVDDVLQLIERSSFEPVYHPASGRNFREEQRARAETEQQADAIDTVRREAERLGVAPLLSEEDIEAAAYTHLVEGYEPDSAVWSALERAYLKDPSKYHRADKEEYDNDIPFDDSGAPGWARIENPFPESEDRSEYAESGERPALDTGAAAEREGVSERAGETESVPRGESRVTVEDTPSGKGVVVRNASEAEMEAIRAALPERASGLVGKDGGITYSKKHEDAIRSALRTMLEGGIEDAASTVIPDTSITERGDAPVTTREPVQAADDAGSTSPAPASPDITIGETLSGGLPVAEAARAARESIRRETSKKNPNPFVRAGERYTLARDVDYLSAGATYEVENASRGEARFANVATGGRTSLPNWQIERALRDGAMQRVERLDPAEVERVEDMVISIPRERYEEFLRELNPPRPRSRSAITSRAAQAGRFINDMGIDRVREVAEKYLEPVEEAPPVPVPTQGAEGAAPAPTGGSTTQRTPPKFAGNKLFTEDRVAAARERLKRKFSGTTLNSGIDPEILMDGVIVMGAHIESGARRFADAARAVASDLGMTLQQLRPYLRAWYNGSRDMLEDNGQDVSDMDGPGAVRAALTMIEEEGGAAPATEPAVSPAAAPVEQGADDSAVGADRLERAFRDALLAGQSFASITEARAFAEQATGQKYAPGTPAAKALDEAIESAVVYAARTIAVRGEGDPVATYQRLVQLYGQQPRLGVRTSTSVEQQAYSTPVPLAYVASQLAGINQNTTVYEPSAGNGALLIDARPTYVTANELNPDRVAQLRAFLPGGTVTEADATETAPAQPVDAVIANPPFGPVKDDAGNTVRFQVDGEYSTNEIDHAIAMKALEAMKDDGRAVLIVGGINKMITDPRKRADAYNGKAKREFYYKLYSQYNVTDHFTVDGDLYAKQGAGWPVDVIVIDGRGRSALSLPAVRAPRQYASWDALQEVMSNGRNRQAAIAVRGADGGPVEQGARPVATDVRDTGRERGGRDNGRAGRDQARQPGAVRAGLADGQPGGVRMDADRAGVDQPAENQQSQPVARRAPVEVEENARQVAYAPGSRSGGMGTLVPVNMQTAISDALEALRQRRGDIDTYVADRLGYTPAELEQSFGAEQVDAIALAIDNIERGAGFIIGDQTGIGKGRVNAAIIRYAIRTNRNAIFVTEKPNLYADMFRDMEDIGLPKMLGRDIKAVMTNSGEKVPLGDGRNLTSPSDAKKQDAILRGLMDKGLKASGVDVLLTTYAQMQTVRGQDTVRRQAIRALARGGVVMFDESHNAGGTPNTFKEAGAPKDRAEMARELVQDADGVFYSSATYAKRPDVMDLYAATDMKLAVDDLEKLGEAISKGGVPMQQVVAAMLARSGQYVRRERSFDGIEYNTPTIEVDRDQYNNVATVLAAIHDFSENYVKDAVAEIDMKVRESGENVAADGSTGSAGASSTNFTAIMHNVVDQMLLAFASENAADRAIEAIRNDEKPVIALASTMGQAIKDYAEDVGAKPGDKVDITFADIFRRYLERTRRYTVKKPFAKKNEKGERRWLTDEELGPAGVAAYRDAMELIDRANLDSLPGSPIDFIASRIEAAGYKVAEITGRELGIDYRPDGTYLKKRGQGDRSIGGRLAAINGFNDGSINAMILNKSGATGLSLHASDRFKDQRKRRMIIVQADGNIDTHMQMLGRVHRTGQVVLPEYDQLVVGVPAARRPAAVLAKKMASLNANTTASRDSALTSSEVLDFMNVYGDEIAARIMEDEPDVHMRLGSPLAETDKGGLNREEAARKVTGRIPLLPIEQQEELYERIEDEYRALIAQKDAAGENALEAKTFDFDAELVSRQEVQAPVVGSTSPFADGVYVERVRVKRVGKPYPGADVVSMVAGGLEINTPEGAPAAALADLQRRAEGIDRERLAETRSSARAYIDTATKAIKDEGKRKAELDKLNLTLKQFEAIRKSFRPGDTVRVKTENGNVYGVVTDVYRSGKAKNPAALGVWRARVAIVDAGREMTIAFSQLQVPGDAAQEGKIAIEKADSIGLFKIIDAFDEMQVESREERSIVTGNLLAGFDYVNGKGAIINYTASGGQVRQGILLPREFNLEKHQKAAAIRLSTAEMVDAYLREGDGSILGQGKTGQVSLQAIRRGNTLLVTAAKAKSSGGEFFLNRDLTRITGDFVSKSGGMVAESGMERAPEVADVLLKAGVKFEVPAGADDKAKELGRKIVERFRPAPPPTPVAPAAPQLTATSPETFANWKRSVESVGTSMGWTIFNDTIGGGYVLMNKEQRVGPFPDEAAAREYARQTQSVQTATSDFADVAQPERTMTQQQRGELEARQQQGMARRGDQESMLDQPGGLFSNPDQDTMFSIADGVSEVEDDGDVQFARAAFFGEDSGGQDAMIRYWNTPSGVVVQAMHSNNDVRGRDMLRWLVGRYGKVDVVEAIPEAMPFWQKMKREGLVGKIERAGEFGDPSAREAEAIPFGKNLLGARESVASRDAEAAAQELVDLLPQLSDAVKKLGIADKVTVMAVNRLMDDPRIAGSYKAKVIRIALAAAQDPRYTLDHEAIHALKDLGLFRPSEWAALVKAAQRDARLMESVRRRYPDLTAEQQFEEAVADMFAQWRAGRRSQSGFARKALQRILDLLTAIRRAVTGARLQDQVQDILRRIESGEVGGRDPDGPGGGSTRESYTKARDSLDIAEKRIEKYAKEMGWKLLGRDTSRQSMSSYQTWVHDAHVDEGGETILVKLRFSNHRLPGTYAQSDFDVHTRSVDFSSATESGDWIAALDHLSDLSGVPVPVAARAEEARVEASVRTRETNAKIKTKRTLLEKAQARLDRVRKIVESGNYSISKTGSGKGWYLEAEGVGYGGKMLLRPEPGAAYTKENVGAVAIADAQGEVDTLQADIDGLESPERYSRIGEATRALMANDTVDGIRNGLDKWRTRLQDRFLPLLRTQQRIELQSGRPLAESANAYLAEELMTGKVGARLQRLADDLVTPLLDRMKALGLSVDELETWLYARHAPERNARISSINSRFAEGTGSGMTDAEAAGILARADAEGKTAALEEAAAMVDAILKFAMDTRVEAGLLSREEADAWMETYRYYVPLRGQGELLPGIDAERPRFGSGVNVRGKESKRAFGRQSRAANILAYSIMQAEEAIARAGRNEVAQAFYNMAKENPDPNFWRVDAVTRKPYWDNATGTVRYRTVTTLDPADEPFTVSLKIDGREHRVTMNRDNPDAVRLANAMRNLDATQLTSVLATMAKFNRYLSTINTAWNPEFIITNALRDIQTATVNLAGVDAQGIVSGTLRDYKKALGASWRANVRGDESGEWGKWYREFVDAGGRVYFNQVEDVQAIANRINRELSAAETTPQQARMKAQQALKKTGELIENVNLGVENAVRLAAYKNAREAGLSKDRAASLAKNLTVNFNRRGDWGIAMNALYLFYNASIQGTARLFQAALTPGVGGRRVRRILYGIAIASFALDMLNRFISDDDDDGESYYDKISEFEKQRNIIVMNPLSDSGDYFKVPIAYGYNVFATIGRAASSYVNGRPGTEAVTSVLSNMVDAFNPVGGSGNLLTLAAPTILDPAVELYLNRDYADRPIYREQQPYGPEEPNSQMYWGSVNPFWKGVTGTLNRMTGGDEVLPGAIDINPEVLEHLTGTLTGAAGTFVMDRLVGNAAKLATGKWDDIEMNDIPMVRKLSGSKPGWYDKSAYYARVEEIEQIASRPKEYVERGNIEAAQAYAMEHQNALALVPVVKAAKKQMRGIKDARNSIEAARASGNMTDAEAREAYKTVKKAEQEIITRFNAAYLDVIEVPTRP